jgi:transcriptional regulator with XRE-family HTH domain
MLSKPKETSMNASKSSPKADRANPPPVIQDDQVLLRILVAQATQRGETLAKLAQALGVTYERLAQWRRLEGSISRAQRSVHENAARYLGVPVVLVLTLAGTVSLADFVWPARESLSARVGMELERLRLDPFLAAFVPAALANADPAVKLLIAFMYRELKLPQGAPIASFHWMTALHQAALGHAEGLQGLEKLRGEATNEQSVF